MSAPDSIAAAVLWLALMLLPGLAARACFRPRPGLTELALWGTLVSPIIVGAVATAGLTLGLAPVTVARVLLVVSLLLVVAAGLGRFRFPVLPPRRDILILGGLFLLVAVLTAWLPATREWWRIRFDAWFHGAVVAQIDAFGAPPEDPYFVGLPLQYMWFYHALVLVVARAGHMDPFRVMAAINVQMLCAFVLAVFAFAGNLSSRFGHRLGATAMALFGFNALFWLFLPLKLVRALTGEVRGWHEIRRLLDLTPLDYAHARQFMHIYYNQEFFLDKFMVATAFSIGLACLAAAWHAALAHVRTGRFQHLLLLFAACVGMLGFHSLVGFVTIATLGGGCLFLLTAPPRSGARTAAALRVGITLLLSLAVTTPYLMGVMAAKDAAERLPLELSLPKIIGIAISCAAALALVWVGRGRLAASNPAARFSVGALASLLLVCGALKLPGLNAVDKLGYFVYIPFAVLAGLTLADYVARGATPARRRWRTVAVAALFVPVNALAFAGCFFSPDEIEVTAAERDASVWVRNHTARDAVFLDNGDRVFLLNTGPRRYYWGRLPYAIQWGYSHAEMALRLHVRDTLYARDRPLDRPTLQALSDLPADAYVILRAEDGDTNVRAATGLFVPVYAGAGIAVARVDRDACRAAIARAPEASTEEMKQRYETEYRRSTQ